MRHPLLPLGSLALAAAAVILVVQAPAPGAGALVERARALLGLDPAATGALAPAAPGATGAAPGAGPVLAALPAPAAPAAPVGFGEPPVVASLLPLPGSVPLPGSAPPAGPSPAEAPAALPPPVLAAADLAALRAGIDALRRGDLAAADAAVAGAAPEARRALEWGAVRLQRRRLGVARIEAFAAAAPDGPMAQWTRRRAEEALFAERARPARVLAHFGEAAPETPHGRAALAEALKASGEPARAADLARAAWREGAVTKDVEARLLAGFPEALKPRDHAFRAWRLILKEQGAEGLRVAAMAGPDTLALAKALKASVSKEPADKLLEAVPASVRGEAAYAFARAQTLRRADKVAEAAKVVLAAPRAPNAIADGDEWWVERRLLARRLLDEGDARTAYRVAREHAADGEAQRVEAEFTAGWIALRFLDEPALAAPHFARAAEIARTPISVARAGYWQGRAAEAMGALGAEHYARAAAYPDAYYGQLARARLGLPDLPLRAARATEEDRAAFAADPAARLVRALHEAGADDLAAPLAIDLAAKLPPGQADLLGRVVALSGGARAQVTLGKAALQKGLPLVQHAFPTSGVPEFDPLPGAAPRAVVLAIARQESLFDPKAASGAGARGLMQMMPATAKRTAKAFGASYDEDLLGRDGAYSARLGSAHLTELMGEHGGSLVMTFAAYNAGGPRVKEWVRAYGDPRSPTVDPVDWVERIPFAETRNYVQRVFENLQVYRAIEGRRVFSVEQDLRQGGPARPVPVRVSAGERAPG